MAERASMPLFVPRTVAALERTATQVARRVAVPLRTMATRALSFADRVLGSWAGTGATVGGVAVDAERPAMRAAQRGGGMVVPRPWYEADADDELEVAARPGTARRDATPTTAARTLPAAERGAAIARTTVTAPPEVVARAREAAQAASETAAKRDEAAKRAAATTAASTTPPSATTTSSSDVRAGDLATEVRAAEALGLHLAPVAPTPIAPAAIARATTPLARALAHTAWVDAQLRAVTAPAPVETRAAGYVFVAPADVARPDDERRAPATRAPSAQSRAVATATTVVPATVVPATVASAAPSPAFAPALPDQRVSTAWPARIAQGVTEFIARLVGVRSEHDATPATTPPAIEPVVASARVPERAFVTVTERPTDAPAANAAMTVRVPAVAASWRPGAAAARVESLGVAVDARLQAAWGEPTMVPARTTASELPATTQPARATVEQPLVTATPATGPARVSQFLERLVGVQTIRATTPLPVPLPTVTASAPLAAEPATTATSARAPARVPLVATTAEAPRPTVETARPTAEAPRPTVEATRPTVEATRPTTEATRPTVTWAPLTLAPGALGVRAEQMGGAVGVRAASLSIEFVDPARLSLLAAAPPMPALVATGEGEPREAAARETIMPAARPLFAPPPAEPRALSAEEWSLVATFPSAATAVQMVTARQAAQWQPAETARTLLVVGPDGPRATATTVVTTPAAANEPIRAVERRAPAMQRAAVSLEYVAPSASAPGATRDARATATRLPDGRAPRGSFTWPRLAEFAPATADWSAPATVTAAEHAKQAAPGAPLWGALPPLVSIAPQLATAASDEGVRAATTSTGAPSTIVSTGRGATSATEKASPAMTLMTAAATREARAQATSGRVGDDEVAPPTVLPTVAPVEAPRAAARTRAPSLPLMTATAAATGAPNGPAARALELARPFLKLIEGGAPAEAGARASSSPRFWEQPQPLVSAVPASDSASRIVEAVRNPPAATSSDDRVSLADLTLIAIASATQQVAASPAGGGPGSGASAAAAPAAAPDAGHGGGGHGGKGNPQQEIEELARAAFAELQRLIEIARERSGHHG